MAYMHRHIKVVALELIGHFSELLQRVFSLRLFEAERLHRFRDLFGDALGTSPVTLWYFRQWWHKAKCVIAVVTSVAQQHVFFIVSSSAIVTNIFCQLNENKRKDEIILIVKYSNINRSSITLTGSKS